MENIKKEIADGKVKVTIEKLTVEFPQELRPVERIIAGILEFMEGYYLVEKEEAKK